MQKIIYFSQCVQVIEKFTLFVPSSTSIQFIIKLLDSTYIK